MGNLVFPQLTSGSLACYPITRTWKSHTIVNEYEDHLISAQADPDANALIWDLTYTGLSAPDLANLQSHFSACQGRLRSFQYLDPVGNLLCWSADLTNMKWLNSSGLVLKPSVADPFGSTKAFAVLNGGPAAGRLQQLVPVPSSYLYCFSAYLRSDSAGSAVLFRAGSGGYDQAQVGIGPSWTRVSTSGFLGGSDSGLVTGIELAPGQRVEMCAPQLEAQRAPSPYRQTFGTSGVFAQARFDSDELVVVAGGPGLFTTRFRVRAKV